MLAVYFGPRPVVGQRFRTGPGCQAYGYLMRHFGTAILPILLAVTSYGCVPVQRHENLQAERDELSQSLKTNRQMLDAAKRDHFTATANHERGIRNLNQQLTDKTREANSLRVQLNQRQKEYEEASKTAFKVAEDNLALIDEKKQLNETIANLKGEILTLQDTIKDLQVRLRDSTTKPPPGSTLPGE